LCVGGSQVHQPGRRRSGLANVARWLASRNSCDPGLRPDAWDAASDRTQNRGGESSRGEEAQESTDSPVPPWPGLRNRNGNGLPRGAKLRSGRAGHSHGEPSVVGTGSSSRHAHGRVEAAVLAIARIRCPGSCVHVPPPGGIVRAKSWRGGESDREIPGGSAPAVNRKRYPQGSKGLREQVRLFGKGKLWRAVPGTRAAWNKAAKRRGPRRTAGSARDPCVPRARKPEPSRGARTLRTAPAGVWRPSPVESALGPVR